MLNCQPADVPVLVAAKWLKPFGISSPYAVKFIGTVDLLDLGRDRSWLAKASDTVDQFWQKRNAAQKPRRPNLRNGQRSLVLVSDDQDTGVDCNSKSTANWRTLTFRAK